MGEAKKVIEVFSCPDCELDICECVIERIRQQENAMVVAQQAIETITLLNKKLTAENVLAVAKVKEWKEKAEKTFQKDIDGKRKDLDLRFEKMKNRDKII